MPVSPSEFFQLFFSELEKRGIPAVVLHGYADLPHIMASDVDYAVRECDRHRIRAIQCELAARHGWLVTQEMRHQVFASYTVLVDQSDPANFVKLDVCSHYVKDRCFLVPDQVLLDGRREYRGFFIPAPAAEFIYVLAKVFGKNKDPRPFIGRLRELWEMDRAGAEGRFASLLGADAGTADSWMQRPAAEWAELDRRMRSRNGYGPGLMLRECGRMIRRVLQPTGMCIAILGVDGAGKSTQIERLRVRECFRNVKYFHFRPMIFESRSGQAAPVTEPHGQEPRSKLASILKVAYYAADQFAGWWLRVAPAMARSSLVVFDRWFDDILVDQRRYRLSAGTGLARLLRRLLRKPDLTFALDAPAEIARARTPELDTLEIERQRAVFRALASEFKKWAIISSVGAPDDIAREIGSRIAVFMAVREQRRSGISAWAALFRAGDDVSLSMRTIPRDGALWLSCPNNTALARAALTLYPAQTQKARVLRNALSASLTFGLPSARSIKVRNDDSFLAFIRKCGGDSDRFAVLPGNPRAEGRRHTFLLFDANHKPCAIIKAGLGTKAVALIHREAGFLRSAPPDAARLLHEWNDDHAAALAMEFIDGRTPDAEDDAALPEILRKWAGGQMIDPNKIPALGEVLAIAPELTASFAGGRLSTALWHGDLAPWNVRITKDGLWRIIDWERGERNGPPAWDWFHYILQRAVLVHHESGSQLAATAEALLASDRFKSYAKGSGITVPHYALLAAYLMHCLHIVRQVDGRSALEGLLTHCRSRL